MLRGFCLFFCLIHCPHTLMAESYNTTISPVTEGVTFSDCQVTSADYGIVGTMVNVMPTLQEFVQKNPQFDRLDLITPQVITQMVLSSKWPDPCHGSQKQLILRTRDKKVLIFYEECNVFKHRSEFFLPDDNFDKFDTFVLYCHTVGYSDGADENYRFFMDYGIPSDKSTLVCLINNYVGWPEDPLTQSMTGNILHLHRCNLGYDFGAWTDAIQCLELDKRTRPFKLILVNDTVRGPFLNTDQQKDKSWTKIFTDLITKEVKLVGTTINVCPDPYLYGPWAPHVQSMLLATDEVGFAIGVKAGIFTINSDKWNLINKCEVGFSREIISAGFNLDCYAAKIRGHDFRSKEKCPLRSGDVQYEGNYFGGSLNPYEVIFFKTNRGIADKLLKAATEAVKSQNAKSF